jgi:NAD(P)-dependent dehydrogenase (short-subunit alcohol dehydrogenase family)
VENKVAIVTGAAAGIGRASALALAKEGAHVIATTARDVRGLEETRALAPDRRVETLQADASSADDWKRLIAHVQKKFHRLDILVNNAGVITEATLVDTTEADWDRTIDTNLKGTFLGCKYAIPLMIASGGGAIVNIGSINSFVGENLHVAYCASKGGVLLLTKCAAIEYSKDKIRANAVCPGWIDTKLNDPYIETMGGRAKAEEICATVQPLGMGRPDQVATAVVYLASDEASLITGTSLLVDGGFTMV